MNNLNYNERGLREHVQRFRDMMKELPRFTDVGADDQEEKKEEQQDNNNKEQEQEQEAAKDEGVASAATTPPKVSQDMDESGPKCHIITHITS